MSAAKIATYDPASLSLTVGGVAVDIGVDIDGGISNGHRVWTFEIPAAGVYSRSAAWRRCRRSGRRVGIPDHAWRKDHEWRSPSGNNERGGQPVTWRWYTDTDANIERRAQAMARCHQAIAEAGR